MKYFTLNLSFFICLLVNTYSWGQSFKPGFDKEEYRKLMLISVRAVNSEEYESKFPEPPNFRKIYQSPIVGLDNFWNLWVNEHKQAVINVRGTTQKPESWLENVYAADWVPQTPFSIQTTDDFSTDNPFVDAKKSH